MPGSEHRGRPEDLLAKGGLLVELLRAPAALFGAVARTRGLLYDRGLLPSVRAEVPVVCIGNITAGGTGKTPMVVWLARKLEASGHRPGVLSRGYGKAGVSGDESDEARLYGELLGDLPRVAVADRILGAARLVEHGAGLVLMDDGFQHRRLARDLDLVLVDATRPWGLPRPERGGAAVRAFLPRGLLRESPAALGRAGAIVITRSDQVTQAELADLELELAAAAPAVPRLLAITAPSSLVPLFAGEPTLNLDQLAGLPVQLCSAIGNPASFEAVVESLGATVALHRRFADHHEFQPGDLADLSDGDALILVTAKDAVKLRKLDLGDLAPRIYVLSIEFQMARGEETIDKLIGQLPEGRVNLQLANLHEGLHG
ncbi:MAG: tetraacyldisaccharide 4'-kinase [Planctomycetota bacterium]|nr:tetraacyldisaccharide 4'-kinase [Planctomycetota bacterium]